jgi:hypothetical protein
MNNAAQEITSDKIMVLQTLMSVLRLGGYLLEMCMKKV